MAQAADQRLSSATLLCAWPGSNKRSYPRYTPCARLTSSPWSRSRPTALGSSTRLGACVQAAGGKAGMRSSVQRSRRAARSAELHCLLCHGVTLSEAESFPLYYSAVFQRAPMRNKINRNTSNELFADKKFFISYAPRFFF